MQRQTIYAMEAGTYVPNTLIALRLAQVLQAKVEDLFSLSEGAPMVSSTQEVDLLPVGERLQPGQPLQLCRVQKRVVGVPAIPMPSYLPAADAVLLRPSPTGKKAAKALIQPLLMDQEYSRRLLIAGCDPGISVLGRHLKRAGIDLVIASCSSLKALELLKRKQIHIAGSHLRDEATGESNLPAVRKLFPAKECQCRQFCEPGKKESWSLKVIRREYGTEEDLARKDLEARES